MLRKAEREALRESRELYSQYKVRHHSLSKLQKIMDYTKSGVFTGSHFMGFQNDAGSHFFLSHAEAAKFSANLTCALQGLYDDELAANLTSLGEILRPVPQEAEDLVCTY